MKLRDPIIFTIVGFLIALLIFRPGCKKPVEYHWETTIDTLIQVITLHDSIPKPEKVYAWRDTGSYRFSYFPIDVPYPVHDTIWNGDTLIAANLYSDSLWFSGKDSKAKLSYKLLIDGTLLDRDFSMILFNERQCPNCPEPVPQKHFYNTIGFNAGYYQGLFVSADYSRKGKGLGVIYGIQQKEWGGYLRLKFNF